MNNPFTYHLANLLGWANARFLRLDCTNGPLTGELQVRGAGIEILGSHTFRMSNNTDTATYWYLQSNVSNTIFSCINNPLKFQYGAAGSNIGAQMDASGNWIFNVAAEDADFTIKKDDGANAYNYDAGTDLQTFNSNTNFASPFTATFEYKVHFNYSVTMDDNTSWTWYDGATKVAWLQADSGTGFYISGVNEPLVFRTGVNGTTQRLVISAAGDFTFNPSFNDDDFIINKNTAGTAFKYDAGDDATYIGDGGTTNYSKFESDGTLEFNGDATVWDDLRTPANNVRALPGQEATWVSYKSGLVLNFASNADQGIAFNAQLPHKYKIGSDIEFHIHMVLPTAGGGGADENVKFDLTHAWSNIDGLVPNATTVSATRNVKDDAANTHYLMEIAGTIDGSGITDVSSMLICSLTRDVSVTNDYTGAVYVMEVDFHYIIDTVGSRTELSK